MKKLTNKIKLLEQEIVQSRQTVYWQYQNTKTQFADKITSKISSPPFFMLAFVAGGLIGKKVKRNLKSQATTLRRSPREKLSLVQKMVALSSEISVAIKVFNRVKPLLARLTQKTNSAMTVTH